MPEYQGDKAVTLPNMFATPGEALQNYIHGQQFHLGALHDLQQQKEMEQWRKAHLIQQLTDTSQHQTSSDVANAIGNKQAQEILEKYSTLAGSMSPMELQAKISADMGRITNGLDAAKNELDLGDKQIAALKQLYPELDAGSLLRQYRQDVLYRRFQNDTDFKNPMDVQASTMDLSDPEFLSRFMTGNKNLSEAIQNPKGVDESSVFVGTPDRYTKFSAKIPFWRKPSFDEAQVKNGFLPKGTPTLSIKGSTIPSESLPSSNGKPFNVVDKDVYDRFAQDGKSNLELIAATRNAFPNYDKFNPTEKEYAKRNVLYRMIEAGDQTQFHPTDVKTPSASLLRFYAGGSAGNTTPAIQGNEFDRLGENSAISTGDANISRGFVMDKEGKPYTGTITVSAKDIPAQTVAILKAAGMDLTLEDQLEVDAEGGKIQSIAPVGGQKIYRKDMENAQLKYNTEPQKGTQMKFGTQPQQGSYIIKGKKYTEKELLGMGYTKEQIAPYKQ